MTCTFYVNSSDKNVVDKSLSTVATHNILLKEPTSILDPTLIVEMSNPSRVNYFYIPEFSRYYYITGISSIRNGVWAITGHVDVLMSYSSQIHSQSGVLARSQSVYNLYLDDDKFHVTSRRIHSTYSFKKPADLSGSAGTFVFVLAGG